MDTPLDHGCNSTVSSSKNKIIYLFRNVAIAAVLVTILCCTAFGTNFCKIIVNWATDSFSFLTMSDLSVAQNEDPTEHLRTVVSSVTDVPVVPSWMPEGTAPINSPSLSKRNNRTIIGAGYLIDNRQISVQIVVFQHTIQNSQTYQKNKSAGYEYVSGGVTHYFSENMDNWCAIWANENVECSIQGQLTEEELQQMIDSIYQKE